MRIYTTPAFPLDYYDISNSDRSKLSSQQRYSSMTIDTDDKENSSCYSNMNNEVTNGNSNSNYRTNHKKAKKKDSITSLMLIEEFDISSIICNLNFASFDDISDPSISYSLKNKRYVLSYSMKNSFSSPVILIQGMYNMDRINYDTPNNSLKIFGMCLLKGNDEKLGLLYKYRLFFKGKRRSRLFLPFSFEL